MRDFFGSAGGAAVGVALFCLVLGGVLFFGRWIVYCVGCLMLRDECPSLREFWSYDDAPWLP